MKKKIAIIIERSDVELGGAERSVSELAQAIGAVGYETHILAAKGRARDEKVHILCADTGGKRTSYKNFAGELKRHIEKFHYDILHSVLPFDFADIYQPRSGTYAESIARKASTYHFPIIQKLKMATAFLNFRRTAWFEAEKNLSSGQTGPLIIAISNYVAKQFENHYHTPQHRMITIPNGVKLASNIEASKIKSIREELTAQSPNDVLFLFVGHDFQRKGLDCLIQAMGLLRQKDNRMPAKLIVAGRANQKPYKQLASKLGIENKIIFLGDVKSIQELIAATDVAVLPTFDDPCSRFILEALAAGKPVITTRFNGATDLFTDNRHGKVIDDPRNTVALCESLEYFTTRDNLSRAANAIIKDNLRNNISVARVANQLNDVYETILKKRKS